MLGASSSFLFRPSWVRCLQTSTTALASRGSGVHQDVPGNTGRSTFNFTPENMKKVKAIIAKYPPGFQKSATIPLLDLAQRQNKNWLTLAAMNKVAKILDLTPMKVYEVATFYTMFNREKVGKHFVQMCTTTPCELCGSGPVLSAIKDYLQIGVGGTTDDGLFTLIEVECLGACVNAPMMQINDDFYEDLTPESAVGVLKKMKSGEEVKPGPQFPSTRRNCENSAGITTLLEPLTGPFAPYLEELDKKKKEESTA
eukprot:CAMPEP_0201483948 /NCGR_PEP_ID=MMETSP0151_2-20130828/8149_1 /ASSEMBLY_ACC=CAM_ASM_000257 /TAXON_ID=200890 /ORGANISM="Paramoeba atlantica, Strain 621/1 / CCAP 1560/9" /LENGTH=254 /DNA_ID=CAMNT_0047867347 /DNA_START=120 /DNA_END=884 /DNA_ORIENTATION=+